MDQDRWKTVNHIFHAALEVSSSERPAFILTASGGDPELQAEVELLLKADQEAGSYLESPLVPNGLFSNSGPLLSLGDELCGRFRILGVVGEGGMGHVYKAYDSELAVHVALKTIRPEIASNPEALARFRQEVRLARRITHPNVCRTFDIERETRFVDQVSGTKQQVVFLTMEFLEGETLDSRLKRTGPLALNEALPLARQIADALTAAHALSIVHRDMKPANLMLVPSASDADRAFRVVITDFGLARVDDAIPKGNNSVLLSRGNRPIGTLAYMAPEQLGGTDVSPATDIYAFGLILFEMVTGTRAFRSENSLSEIARRFTGPPPSPRALIPSLPNSWCHAIEGCLHSNPAERFASPSDVIAVLEERSVEHLPGPGIQNEPNRVGPRGLFRHRYVLGALTALTALALLATGLRYWKSRADSKVSPGALVYLAPVQNETKEKTLDNLTGLFQAGLSQSVQINLLGQERVGDTLQRMTKPPDTVIDAPIAREIAMRTGSVRVVLATVSKSGSEYRLDVDVEQPDNTPARYREHWPNRFSWKTPTTNDKIPPDLLAAIRNASDWIRKQVGESEGDVVHMDVPPEDVTTGSWEALAELEKAFNLQGKLKTEAAIMELQKAVQLDPQCALAYARLGDLQVSTGAITDGLHSYQRALDLTELSRLNLRERDRIRGLAAFDSGDFETAASAFRDYAVNYEHDYLGWFYLGYPLIMLGRRDEGIADIRRSYELNPEDVSPAAQLAMFDAATGNRAETIKVAEHLRQIGYPGYEDFALGLLSFLEGNYEDAKKHFTDLRQEQGPPGSTRGTMMLAHLAAEEGQYLLSDQLLTDGINVDRQEGSLIEEAIKLIDRASIESKLGKYSEMLTDIQAALSLDKSPPRINSAALIMSKAMRSAPAAGKERIRKALNELDREYAGKELGIYSKVAKLHLHAQALWANGDRKDALATARRANAIDGPIADRSYWVLLLLEAAEHEPNPGAKKLLLEEAYDAAARTVLDPGLAWKDANRNLPGFMADEMEMFLTIASQLNRRNENVEHVQDVLRALSKETAKNAA